MTTNYEKIKQMSFDEMLDFFERHCSCGLCIMSNKKPYHIEINSRQCIKNFKYRVVPCRAGINAWLESEEEY